MVALTVLITQAAPTMVAPMVLAGRAVVTAALSVVISATAARAAFAELLMLK
jgi:hypothetical protein